MKTSASDVSEPSSQPNDVVNNSKRSLIRKHIFLLYLIVVCCIFIGVEVPCVKEAILIFFVCVIIQCYSLFRQLRGHDDRS
jgi:hypothetical protein